MPKGAQVGLILLLVVVLAGAFWFLVLKDIQAQNQKLQSDLNALNADNQRVEAYLGPKEKELDRNIALLQQQLERQKQIVPDQEQADKFMHMMTDQAAAAGIAVRRYEAKSNVVHDYYTEAPFDMDVDGPFYAVLSFFEKVKNMDRIVNVNNLQIASVTKAQSAKVKKTYQYSPTETVAASFQAVTFYSPVKAATPSTGQPATAAPAAGKK